LTDVAKAGEDQQILSHRIGAGVGVGAFVLRGHCDLCHLAHACSSLLAAPLQALLKSRVPVSLSHVCLVVCLHPTGP
jgi:hypothetical protein